MTTNKPANFEPDWQRSPYDDRPPKLNLLTMFRLGLFQLGLGIMSLLTLGLLNRIMINELTIPSTVAAVMVAVPLFVSPVRIWFGQMSDAKPILGYHRTGYVWLGAVLFSISLFIAVQVMWQFGLSLHNSAWSFSTYAWAGLLGLVFAIYGIAISASSTPFAALLVDITDEEERSKLIGIVWSMLMVGIVIGAITMSRLLPCSTEEPAVKTISLYARPEKLASIQSSVNFVCALFPAIVMGLSVIATAGIEKKFSRLSQRLHEARQVEREDRISLGRAIRVLTANRQTGIFFTFLLIMTISLFMQDAILEPYGKDGFGMGICATTQLNAFFGIGTLLGISGSGFLLVPRIGKQNTAKYGCLACAGTFILLIFAGTTSNPNILKSALLIFGLASGVTTTGAISLMLDLTAVATAGTFIGAWGLAQALARGLATVAGGAVLDIGRSLFTTPVLSYGLVFLTQAIGMLLAVFLLKNVDVAEFQSSAKTAISQIIANELD
ncbi:BCD family MFS transporter [Pseudanabaena sp. PCC 6802]|uniref:BCD family MFS transporter n=1 Tax=Pseudanabaena sp. PCC 6802 TaxID=118173 RepID=UPI000345F0B3|nr:BCD family MFS transporter [Pseudanabaena sp. PCC 6802]